MQLLSRFGHGLRAEGRIARRALRSPWLGALLLTLALLLTCAAQRPVSYLIDVGCEEGYNSDLPLLTGFFPFEPEKNCSPLNWRWTTDRAHILLPGSGFRPLAVTIRTLSVNNEVSQNGAQSFGIWSNNQLLASFPVLRDGGTFSFLLPVSADWPGDSAFEVRNATFVPSGDQRAVGIPFDRITVGFPGGPVVPPIGSIIGWLCVALLAWLAVCRCGFADRTAFGLLIVPALLLALAATLDPPRTAFGVPPGLVALGWGFGLVVVLAYAVPWLARRLTIPLGDGALRWLLLLSLVAFSLRYGGKIYPQSMWGDLGFHTNRFFEVASGRVLLLSRNRGVDFPYPPALYLLIALPTLLGVSPRELLRFAGALLDSLSPFLVYTIGVLAYGSGIRGQQDTDERAKHGKRETRKALATQHATRSTQHASHIWAVAAAGLYSLSAATFMTVWWGFSTHVFTQFAHLLLITTLVVLVPPMLESRTAVHSGFWLLASGFYRTASLLTLLASLVFLGHFGFWLNMSLLGSFGILVLIVAAWRGRVAWRVVWSLALALACAEAISIAGFYSAYSGLFFVQAQAARAGGLTGMAGRLPTPADKLWYGLWYDGFRTHFGFFPVPLAIIGAGLWARDRTARSAPIAPIVLTLIVGTFVIALGFAVLPFISGSTLSTRWLMFSAWAIAIATIYVVRATWRWGWPIRLIYLLMASYILWITASQWLAALAFRIRPPEPF